MTNTHLTRDLGLALIKEHVPTGYVRLERYWPSTDPVRASADCHLGAQATGTALSQGAAEFQPLSFQPSSCV